VSGDHAMVQSQYIQCGLRPGSTAVARGAVARLLRLQKVASAAWPLHWRCITQHWCEGKIWQLQRCSSCLLRRLNLVVRYCLMVTQSVTLSQRDRCIVHCTFYVVSCILGNFSQQHPLHSLRLRQVTCLSSWQHFVCVAGKPSHASQVSYLR
jgi:hypothetical protein